jgi:hypothetical protein
MALDNSQTLALCCSRETACSAVWMKMSLSVSELLFLRRSRPRHATAQTPKAVGGRPLRVLRHGTLTHDIDEHSARPKGGAGGLQGGARGELHAPFGPVDALWMPCGCPVGSAVWGSVSNHQSEAHQQLDTDTTTTSSPTARDHRFSRGRLRGPCHRPCPRCPAWNSHSRRPK